MAPRASNTPRVRRDRCQPFRDPRADGQRIGYPELPLFLLFLQYPGQDVGPIGHYAVDAESEQPAHGGFIVDGPDVHPQSPLVRCSDKPRRHYPQ